MWLFIALVLLSNATFAHEGHGAPGHVRTHHLFALDALPWWVTAGVAFLALLISGALLLRSTRKRAA